MLLSFMLWSCHVYDADFGQAENYLPGPDNLRKGIVNKYYSTYNPDVNSEPRTDISYTAYQLKERNEIIATTYNAGFEPLRVRSFAFRDDQMLLTEEINFNRNDTLSAIITEPVFLSWKESNKGYFEKTIVYDSLNSVLVRDRQIQMDDTLVLDRRAKKFKTDLQFSAVHQSDTTNAREAYEVIYVGGIGLYSTYSKSPGGAFSQELVEQMSLQDFEALASHGRNRIGYIDPANTLDRNTDFKICGSEEEIADYYNSFPKGDFARGKKAMLEIIHERLLPKKLIDDSGYLTFRFVVNCSGEAGRFVTEQSDLDFQPKKFNPETIDHLYDILYNLKTWSPSEIRGEKRDAYFYITFKLKEGRLTDVLP